MAQESTDVPHYQILLDFIDVHARSLSLWKPKVDAYQAKKPYFKSVASHAGIADPVPPCVLCKSERHPLYICQKFKSFSQMLWSNNLCINCLKPGHFTSHLTVERCQNPHHTLIAPLGGPQRQYSNLYW